ncbi:MAG: glycosyltransferase [Gaiellaceae bacterium]
MARARARCARRGPVLGAAAAPSLCVLLSDEQWWVRTAAKDALRGIGSEAVSALLSVLVHADPFARTPRAGRACAPPPRSARVAAPLDYPEYEVVVVNDGSTDSTLERLREAFRLEPFEVFVRRVFSTEDVRATYRSSEHPNLVVVDKANGGKADALNAGLNVARYRYVCGVPAPRLPACLLQQQARVVAPRLHALLGGRVPDLAPRRARRRRWLLDRLYLRRHRAQVRVHQQLLDEGRDYEIHCLPHPSTSCSTGR